MASPIKIGVFIPNEAQTLDVATVDVLGTMSREYLGPLTFLPANVSAMAPSVTVYYITTAANDGGIPCTSGMSIKPTHLYSDAEVAPGKLDIVVVPGPAPGSVFEEGGLRWLREQAGTKGVDVLSVCTGAFICCASGIADGRLLSGPRGLQGELGKQFPKVKLVGDERRWVRDGNLWSSGRSPSLCLTSLRCRRCWDVELTRDYTRRRDERQ